MTHKSQSAPTETSGTGEANRDTTLIREDAQRAGLIWSEGAKEQKKNKTTPQRFKTVQKNKK